MKIKTLILLAFVIFFLSCQITEKMTINEDGSGKISFELDGSGLMMMLGDKMKSEASTEKYDTIMHFKDMLYEKRDSIATLSAEEQADIKKLENFSMEVSMNAQEKKMNFAIFADFDKTESLTNMLNTFEDGFKLASKGNKKIPGAGQSKSMMKQKKPNTKVHYKLTKNSFKRYVEIIDTERQKREADSLGQAKAMLATSKYKLVYTFPKPIKSISVDDAYFSQDKKTITIEKGFLDYITNPKTLDFTVDFEN